MKKSQNSVHPSIAVGSVSAIITALIAAALYIFSYITYYESDIHHYKAGEITTVAFGVLFAISFVINAVSSVVLRKNTTLRESENTGFDTFAFSFAALMFVLDGIMAISSVSSVQFATKLGEISTKLTIPLAFLAAVPFVMAISSKRNSTLHRIFSLFPVLWGVFEIFKYYFDISDLPLNSPELTLTIVSLCAAVLFFLAYARETLGIGSAAISLFGSVAAISLSGFIALSRTVLFFTNNVEIVSLSENLALVSIAIMAAARLVSLSTDVSVEKSRGIEMEALFGEENGNTDGTDS